MPLTIFFSSPGTYTIEDDGIRGNNTSVVKDASGTVLFPFVHPGDSIDFIAEVAGITFVFNTTDSFGTANVTVGSLTDTNLTPDHIIVRNLRTDAFITLAADLTITEGGSDFAADIQAAGLIMSAGTGVGTAGNALETQTTFIEAETNTGGINIANFGSVQIGGLSPDVAGLNVATSGNLRFSTVGFIVLADSTGAASVHGGDISGNVTLTANGADSDIFSNIDQVAVQAPGGGITLVAGRDIALGTSGTNFNNDLLATQDITIIAGRDFQLDGTSDVRTGAFGGVVGGTISIQAGRTINLSNLTGGLQTIQAFAGDVLLTTGPGGSFIENAAFPGAVQTTDDIFLTSDNVLINTGGLNTTGIGSITVRPSTLGRAVDLGTALDGPAALGLSDAEFDQLYSLFVNIGDSNTGPVQISAPLTPFIVDDLSVRSGTDIVVNASISLPGRLTLQAGDDIHFTAGGSFTGNDFVGLIDDLQNDDNLGGLGVLDGTLTLTATSRMTGSIEGDTIRGSAGNDILDGRGGVDFLFGRGGNDTLDGGAGNDTMAGGLGNDVYYVDSLTDTVQEAAAEGTDTVYASVSYALAAGAEIETLSVIAPAATTAINLTGNVLNQTIIGNAGANVINASGGNDVIIGGAGNDTMAGGSGNDVFYVDAAGDVVQEVVGNGTDTVYASVSYVLTAGAQVEALSVIAPAATTALNLTGNEFANTITGNAGINNLDGGNGNDTMLGGAGNDMLTGGSGIDTMTGGTGDDRYIVDNAADVVVEGAGQGTADRIFAAVSYTLAAGVEVELLTTVNDTATTAINLTGNDLAQTISGNAGANTLTGGGGNDALNGGLGNDTLNGGTGSDAYRFASTLGAGNIDTILGYNVADDSIHLEDTVFAGLPLGALAAGAFNTGAAASEADDRIIYNSATGALLFDADGTGAGAAIQFATLSPGLAMAAGEFLVI